jgi:hypothetical protein
MRCVLTETTHDRSTKAGGRNEQEHVCAVVGSPFRHRTGVRGNSSGPTQPAITEEQAHALGVDAYIYLYPLVTMDITRKQFTNTYGNYYLKRAIVIRLGLGANLPEMQSIR